ncbi:MAG: class I SAM-dependent methyltransferase [Rhodospirillales bacterium]|nr:class I SAM-dependent methyltransferase [Rhodospirillales bacterium]
MTKDPSGGSWTAFWGGPHRIYVNEVHLRAHYAEIARDVAALVGRETRVLLDFGCGDALAAPEIAGLGIDVLLYDAAGPVRDRLAKRFTGTPGIRVLAPAEWDALRSGTVDVILVNSVVQYLTREALAGLLPRFRALLSVRGCLVVADVIPPGASLIGDIAALLRPALRHGFLMVALRGLVATYFSDYRRLRSELGLTSYRADEMVALLGRHGFAASRLVKNIGFNRSRMTFVATVAR